MKTVVLLPPFPLTGPVRLLRANPHINSPGSISIESGEANTLGLYFIGNRSEIIYVDSSASGTGDGSNWTNAYTDLSKAAGFDLPFSEVWVARDAYKPRFSLEFSFYLPMFQFMEDFGFQQNRNERDSSSNPTILSGNIGDINDGSDNSFHVVVPSNLLCWTGSRSRWKRH